MADEELPEDVDDDLDDDMDDEDELDLDDPDLEADDMADLDPDLDDDDLDDDLEEDEDEEEDEEGPAPVKKAGAEEDDDEDPDDVEADLDAILKDRIAAGDDEDEDEEEDDGPAAAAPGSPDDVPAKSDGERTCESCWLIKPLIQFPDDGNPRDDIATNAAQLDAYGDPGPNTASVPQFFDNDSSWRDALSDLDGASAFQVRISFISNPVSNKVAELSSLGFAWKE